VQLKIIGVVSCCPEKKDLWQKANWDNERWLEDVDTDMKGSKGRLADTIYTVTPADVEAYTRYEFCADREEFIKKN